MFGAHLKNTTEHIIKMQAFLISNVFRFREKKAEQRVINFPKSAELIRSFYFSCLRPNSKKIKKP